jgi:hypothetical protein
MTCPTWESEAARLGDALLPSARSLGSYSGGGGSCCPLVFNPYTLFALIAGIALATYFLRLVVVVQAFPPRRRRRSLGGMGDVIEDVMGDFMGESRSPRRFSMISPRHLLPLAGYQCKGLQRVESPLLAVFELI